MLSSTVIMQNMSHSNNIHRKTPVLESLFNKDAGLQLSEKETPMQVFSCEYCKMFQDSIFCRTPLVPAFDCSNQIKIF